ncbi:hypothetical protein GDO86_012011 [Hymenochirus boettgeri]|uniref:Microtubule-associated protein n=1 Tax=Hymenochirus boettgeri TaxID=247094 RepID=A0A8T2JLQ2_9PIPI|nr:hypothetical protein GDO86_012011 [Hymenochirus boettgeri]
MADLDHNFSLQDALTDGPPEIEPEIKQDFITSLENEQFDDVVGETCGRSSYVPLLDGDETSEPKNKSMSEENQTECPSNHSIIANREHGLGENHVADPFGSNIHENALSDLPPFDSTIRPAFSEHFEADKEVPAVLEDGGQAGCEEDLLGQTESNPLEEGWLTDSNSKTEGTDTPSGDISEITTATFGDTPSDASVRFPLPVSQSDNILGIWQPTVEEQLALSSPHTGDIRTSFDPFSQEDLKSQDPEELVPEYDKPAELIPSVSFDASMEPCVDLISGEESIGLFPDHPNKMDIEEPSDNSEFKNSPEYLSVEAQNVQSVGQLEEAALLHSEDHLTEESSISPDLKLCVQSAVSEDHGNTPEETTNKCIEERTIEGFNLDDEVVDSEQQPGAREIPVEKQDLIFDEDCSATQCLGNVSEQQGLAEEDHAAEEATTGKGFVPEINDPFHENYPDNLAVCEEAVFQQSSLLELNKIEPESSSSEGIQPEQLDLASAESVALHSLPHSDRNQSEQIIFTAEESKDIFSPPPCEKVEPEQQIQADELRVAMVVSPERVHFEQSAYLTEGSPAEVPSFVPETSQEKKEEEQRTPEEIPQNIQEAPVSSDVATDKDITSPPNKELPPSPEKKIKASATTPIKTPASKTKPAGTPNAQSPRKPVSATPTQQKKPASPATTTTPKRPLGSAGKITSATPKDSKDTKPKNLDLKSPVKSPDKKTAPLKQTPTTPRAAAVKAAPLASKVNTTAAAASSAGGTVPKSTLTPKRPIAIKNGVKPAEAKKPISTKSPTDLSRPKSVPTDLTKTTGQAPTSPGAATSRPKTTRPAVPKTAAADVKKVSTAKSATLTKPSTAPLRTAAPASKAGAAPKQPRPATVPDLKNVRSKIGSTDNLKHQPGGGKATVEKKPVPASTARKTVLSAVPKTAAAKSTDTKETSQKQSNGKVQIVSKRVNYSHVQSKCGSKDNIKHVPGGGNATNAAKPAAGSTRPQASGTQKPASANVQIINKKIDVSKVSSKCGSKATIKHKPGGETNTGNSKQQEMPKENQQANVKKEESQDDSEQVQPSENGDIVTPTDDPRHERKENGLDERSPAEGDSQRESLNTLIPETN